MTTTNTMNTFPLRDLLPHDHPMILIDAIESVDEHGLTASVTVRADALFIEPQGIPAWLGIEYMGQAIAAHAGWCARRAGRPVRVGFLVGTRRYESGCSHFPLGAKLEIAVATVTSSAKGLQVFECRISGAGVSAHANLNVFMPDDVDEFLRGAAHGMTNGKTNGKTNGEAN
jgi:predicted hotdog family 3-hydroxylacyl-ACP dehydratase